MSAELAALSHNGQLVYEKDFDRFLLSMTATPEAREDLFALFAFNFEVAKIYEVTTETVLGDIRFQWWRDALEECDAGRPRRHATVTKLAPLIQSGRVPCSVLEDIIEARQSDLVHKTPQSFKQLESFARATGGNLAMASALALGTGDKDILELARDAGTGGALVGLVRAIPYHQQHRRCYIPSSLMEEIGLNIADYSEARRLDLVAQAARLLCRHAINFLDRAYERAGRREAIEALFPAFGHGTLARMYLRLLKSVGWNPYDPRLARPPLARGMRLMIAKYTRNAP